MSRNASGTYSLPLSNVVAGNVIEATWANTTLGDIASEMTDSLSRSGMGGMLAALKLQDGAAATPSLTFINDTDLGLYRVSANNLGLAAGGALMMTINGSEVQVNPATGLAQLDIISADDEGALVISSGDSTADEGRVKFSVTSDVFTINAVDDDDTDGQSLLTVDLADDQPVVFVRPVTLPAGTTLASGSGIASDEPVISKSSGYTAVAGDRSKLIVCTADLTLALTAAATLGDGWNATILAEAEVTIDPDGSETINGLTTFILNEGQSAKIWCDGTEFYLATLVSSSGIASNESVISKSSGYTAVAGDRSKLIVCTANLTLALTAAATLGDGWNATILAEAEVTIDPDGSETINGLTTFILNEGQSAKIWCDGTGFYIAIKGGDVPIGALMPFAGATLPHGWLWCDGSALDASGSTELQPLFDVIGNTYGGSDNTDFQLPDLRGRTVFGKDNMDNSVGTGGGNAARLTSGGGGVDGDTLGDAGGDETVTLAAGNLPTFIASVGTNTGNILGGGTAYVQSANSSGGSAAFSIVPPGIVQNYIIRYL